MVIHYVFYVFRVFRIRDKYGVDLSSVEFKSPDIQNINATYENAMSASGTGSLPCP